MTVSLSGESLKTHLQQDCGYFGSKLYKELESLVPGIALTEVPDSVGSKYTYSIPSSNENQVLISKMSAFILETPEWKATSTQHKNGGFILKLRGKVQPNA